MAFNTFSSTKDTPKYRLFIPTDDTMEADCYPAAIEEFIRRIASDNLLHGFDPHPKFACALYYLPCQAASGHSFFIEHPGAVLGIEEWLKNSACLRTSDTAELKTRLDCAMSTHRMLGMMDVLGCIPAENYHIWFQVLSALYNEYGDAAGFTLARWWSQKSLKYNPHELQRKWANIKASTQRKITIGTVYYLAKQYR